MSLLRSIRRATPCIFILSALLAAGCGGEPAPQAVPKDTPRPVIDRLSVVSGGSALVNVLANDTDPENDPLTIAAATDGAHGATVIEAGQIRYTTATATFAGTDTFTYTVTDGVFSADATVVVTVGDTENAPPAANPDDASVAEDGSVFIDVLANDTDPDGDNLTVVDWTSPGHGSLLLYADAFAYAPDDDFAGADSFSYVILDGNALSTGTVSITVSPVNDAPVAENDAANIAEDGIALVNVLANDADVDGDTLEIDSFSQGASGSVSLEGGSLRYAPDAEFSGEDSFTYTVTDGALTDNATVAVTVDFVNDPPVAGADNATVIEDGSVLVDVLANDTDPEHDPLTASIHTSPAHGTAVAESASIRYTPDADFFGEDSFTYAVSDGEQETTGLVSITVAGTDDPPVAVDDTVETDEDTFVATDVLANDIDPDKNTLVIDAFTDGAHGTVAESFGELVYTPAPNFFGDDSFTYTTANDGGGTDNATVSVRVAPVNDAPVAADDNATGYEQRDITINALTNDTDVDGDNLTVASFTQPTNGTVTEDNGTFTYVSDALFSGADSFTYTATDGGLTDTATVSVQVEPTTFYSSTVSSGSMWSGFIRVDVLASGSITFITSAESADTYMYLWDSTQTTLIASDMQYGDGYSHIVRTLSVGTYYIRLQNSNGTGFSCHLDVYLTP